MGERWNERGRDGFIDKGREILLERESKVEEGRVSLSERGRKILERESIVEKGRNSLSERV